ncbi:MAG: endonuclease/exonuclease/phosphatase family protein [Albidovulum sp.]|uniref:endonuclease/exonuclease/phosphatase family protein n=1 Tax=Albidovulum sp. TaxID=1872424 RepID=UPI003C84C7D1
MARRGVSFASFNLYNLNEPGLAIYKDTDGWDQDIYDRKIAWTAVMLRIMKADVFGFQELWHADSLTAALAMAGLDSEYTAIAPPGHAGQKIVCAAAVRSAILTGTPRWIENFPDDFILKSGGDDSQTGDIEVLIDAFSRPVLRLTIQPHANAPEIVVFVCHFKSKGPTQIFREGWYDKDVHGRHSEAIGGALSTIRRTAEAMALRMMLTEEMKNTDTPVVVIGDCNDGQHSNTHNILTGQPRFLTTLSKGGGDNDLYSAQTLQQYRSERDVYYTHVYQDMRESLDHILVSQEFYDNSRKRIWAFDGLEIANDHLNSDDQKESGTGDHGVVRARFVYNPPEEVVA